MSADAIASLHQVSVSVGGHDALCHVSLVARPGEVLAVAGGDGAGKSTLLRTLVGLHEPRHGTVDLPAKERVGFMPASDGSWATLTVAQNMAFAGSAQGMGRQQLAERTEALLRSAALNHVPDRLAKALSGGMRKKLGFCMAILHQPDLVVLDEPSTGVDPVSRVDLWRMMATAASQGAAVVLATTYLDEAERASSLLLLDDGQAIITGPPQDAVDSMPGVVTATRRPVRRELAWRRGTTFHQWWPDGEPCEGDALDPDLEDVVIVASLRARADRAAA